MKERRYDVDWIRVFATFAVFLFHCTLFFVPIGGYLQNKDQNEFLFLFFGWFDVWQMPLLFLLSGFSSWYSLKRRSGRKYLIERVKRLLVPLYTVGLFILLIPQSYFLVVAERGYTGSIWQWIPDYWAAILSPEFSLQNPMSLFLIPFPAHLWFLQHLFLISLVVLPLLRYLKTDSGQRLIEKMAGWSQRRGGILMFIIPLVVVRIALRGLFPGSMTWADLVYYGTLFIIGYLIASDQRFTEGYKRVTWVCLALGLFAFFAEITFIGPLGYPYPGGAERYSGIYMIFQIILSVGNFCWTLFILGLGAKYLNFNNKRLAYTSEASYPFYTLHLPIVWLVAWLVLRWDLGILSKYLLIVVISLVLIMPIFELLIRRFNVVRFLFGMRPKKKLSSAPATRPEGTDA